MCLQLWGKNLGESPHIGFMVGVHVVLAKLHTSSCFNDSNIQSSDILQGPVFCLQTLSGCRIAQVVMQYCVGANYFWLLVEGLYLHNLLVLLVFSENSYFCGYLAIGWGQYHFGCREFCQLVYICYIALLLVLLVIDCSSNKSCKQILQYINIINKTF